MKDKFQDIVDPTFTAQMEEELDKVEEGNVDWKKVLSEFYDDFEAELHKAEQELDGERIKVPDEVSEEICRSAGEPRHQVGPLRPLFGLSRMARVRGPCPWWWRCPENAPEVRRPAFEAYRQEQEDGQAVYLLLLRAPQQQGREPPL